MSDILLFKSQAELTSEQNLVGFIKMCRDDFTVFGDQIEWDNWLWPKLANFTKLGASGRSVTPADKMRTPFMDFAKAYFRYQQGHNPTGTRNEIKALKVLEEVLAANDCAPDIANLTPGLLDQATILAREHFGSSAYQAGRELQRLAEFVSKNKLIRISCRDWINPIKRPADNNKIGRKGKELRDKRLPKDEAVMAMADIFAQNSSDPKDIFTSSTFALLMSAPCRISEVLSLPYDCEVEEPDKDGIMRYGLRFFSGKGYGGNIKWVSTLMVPVAKEAIQRLKTITDEGRKLGVWIEDNPEEFYRNENCPAVGIHEPLTRFQACSVLNLRPTSFGEAGSKLYPYKFRNIDGVTLSEIWQYAKARWPENFPWVNQSAGVRYGNALFAMTANSLHAARAEMPLIPWLPDVNIVNNDFSPRESLGENVSHRSIFDRFDYRYSDGTRMKMTTHQLRHLIDTMGQRGGLSEEEIARWAGRADIKQNRTYNHVTEIEQVERLEQYQLDSAFEYGKDLVYHEPVSRADFELMPKGAVHTTLYGFCVHDFVMTPCGKLRDCTNCEEHVCIKKDDDRKSRIELHRQEVKAQVQAALEGIQQGLFGADRWLEHHQLSLSRLDELVGALNDPNIADGALIKLRNENSFSHLKRALRSKKIDLIATSRTDSDIVVDDLLILLGGDGLG